jgi:hypothetical protein
VELRLSGAVVRAGNRLLTYPPERAAEEIVTAVERRRPRLPIALSARVPDLVARLFPAHYSALLGLVLKAAGPPK